MRTIHLDGRSIAVAALVVLLGSCSRTYKAPTDDPNWLVGYNQGLREGIDQGHDDVCNAIKRYKPSMAEDLDENTQICGWPSKGHGNSN